MGGGAGGELTWHKLLSGLTQPSYVAVWSKKDEGSSHSGQILFSRSIKSNR